MNKNSKSLEGTLRESKERLLYFANLVPDLLWESEPNGTTNWYNQRWLEYTGQHFNEAIGWGWVEAIHPDDREHSAKRYAEAVKAGKPLQQEHRIRRHDGVYRWFIIHTSPVQDENHKVVKMYGAATDIHDRKQLMAAFDLKELEYRDRLENEVQQRTLELSQNRALLQATLDSNVEMIQVFKAVRDQEGTIVDFIWILNNATSEKIFGDVIGKSLLENNPAVAEKGIFANFVSVVENGVPIHYEKHYKHEQFDGWFYQSVVKLDDGVATNTINITERKRAEEQVRKLETDKQREIFEVSLNALEEERQRISESLHNGIAQILYGIKINLSGLNTSLPETKFKENKTYVYGLLTEAIIETRRISHELMPTTLEQFGLKKAIDDICQQMSDDTKFSCKVSGMHKRLERYMELAIYRTVQELMNNVVKHASATTCIILIDVSDSLIRIAVRDNGKGIEMINKRNNGIGLAAIKSKVKLLNGEVKVQSAAGEGTSIEISIPQPLVDKS